MTNIRWSMRPMTADELDELSADLLLNSFEPVLVDIPDNDWVEEYRAGPRGDGHCQLIVLTLKGRRTAHLIPGLRANRRLARSTCGNYGPFESGTGTRLCRECLEGLNQALCDG